MNPAAAMGWPLVSGSFVPRLLSCSCLKSEQLEGEVYRIDVKTDFPITLGITGNP